MPVQPDFRSGYARPDMDRRILDPQRESLAGALVALSRYTVELTETAREALGHDVTDNRSIQIALTLSQKGPLTPTDLREITGAPRSSISRALKRLEAAGLVSRRQDSRDRRSVLLSLTRRGRLRVAELVSRLDDYFVSREPLVKEAFDLLDVGPAGASRRAVDAAGTMSALVAAGADWVSAAVQALRPFEVVDFTDRFTLVLVRVYGTARPTQIADELRLTPSGTSGVLTRLESARLITRRHDLTPGDRRAVGVELTQLGQQAVDAMLDVFAAHAPALSDALLPTVPSAPQQGS